MRSFSQLAIGRDERKKRRPLRHAKRWIEPVQCVHVPMSDRKSGYIVPRERIRISAPLYSISRPAVRAQPQNTASTLSKRPEISTLGREPTALTGELLAREIRIGHGLSRVPSSSFHGEKERERGTNLKKKMIISTRVNAIDRIFNEGA